MVINFEIIIVRKDEQTPIIIDDEDDDIDDNYDNEIYNVLLTIANAKVHDFSKINSVFNIKKKLLFACDVNNKDVILIMGDIKFVQKNYITKMIKSIIDSKLSENIAESILNIEMTLNNIMPDKTICGVRDHSLIIDLSGSEKNVINYLKAIKNIIPYMVYLIRRDKDQNVPLHDVATISDNNSTEQRETKSAAKCQKSTSLIDLSFDTSIIKRRKKSFPMISMEDAYLKIREIIKGNVRKVTCERVQLSDAYGRILCETVKTAYDLPPFRTSTKHGYAVLVTDGKGLRKVLNVKNTFPSMSLEPGTCVWVKSGAPVPDEATAVVEVNDTEPVEKSESSDDTYIEIMIEPEYEDNVRPVGYDLMKGKTVVNPCMRIGPMEIALLAASGRKEVLVIRNISIGVLSIGSNIGEPGERLEPGLVYDVNRATLISLLKEKHFHSLDLGIVNNKPTSIRNKIEEALQKVDLLVTTGSTNDKDLLKTILEECFNADIHFGNVNMKPGKSTIFATCKIDDTMKYFLCLPGNPISASIGARIFLLPLVDELCSNFQPDHTIIPAHMENQYALHSRSRIAWTILEWSSSKEYALAYSKGNTLSDKFGTAAGANAFLFLPEKESSQSFLKSVAPALIVKFPKRFNDKNFYDTEHI